MFRNLHQTDTDTISGTPIHFQNLPKQAHRLIHTQTQKPHRKESHRHRLPQTQVLVHRDTNTNTNAHMIGCLQKGMPINLAPYYWKTNRDSKKVIKNNHRMKLIHDKLYINRTVKNLRESLRFNYTTRKKRHKRRDPHSGLLLTQFLGLFYWCMCIYRLSESQCAVLCCLLVDVISQTHLQAFWPLAQVGHVEGGIGIRATNDNNIHIFCKGDYTENEAFMKT